MHPSFPDPPTSPFFQEIELVPAFFGINVNDIAIGAAVAAVGIIGVHAVTKEIRGRGKEEDDTGKPESAEKRASN
jgi:Ni,Fe-hydrogenase I small subunit